MRVLGIDVEQKGFLGAYLLVTLTFSCQYDQPVGSVLADVLRRVLRTGTTRKRVRVRAKRVVLGAGQGKTGGLRFRVRAKKGDIYRGQKHYNIQETCPGVERSAVSM